ncbi:hypothetical protein Barb4_03643 [Bacteroidales bacterium Barb4]|nr:hypothetical protein Barb4_03643 [Bacteroidales bacterium Barb4]
MHIAFDGGKQYLACLGGCCACLCRFNGGLEDGNGFLHRAGSLNNLREEELTLAKECADLVHAAH